MLTVENFNFYHDFAYVILVKIIDESFTPIKEQNHRIPKFIDEEVFKLTEKIMDENYKSNIRLFLHGITEEKILSNIKFEYDEYLELLNQMKSMKAFTFEKTLKNIVNNEERKFGKYFKHSMKSKITFLYLYAERRCSQIFGKVISGLFPYLDGNSSFAMNIMNEKYIRIYDLEDNKEAEELFKFFTENELLFDKSVWAKVSDYRFNKFYTSQKLNYSNFYHLYREIRLSLQKVTSATEDTEDYIKDVCFINFAYKFITV